MDTTCAKQLDLSLRRTGRSDQFAGSKAKDSVIAFPSKKAQRAVDEIGPFGNL
jgi:hypothetical protein